MSWTWNQGAGTLSRDGQVVARGYSGRGPGLNNPAMQNVPRTGPIPRGRWKLMNVYASTSVGPYTITLWRLDDVRLDDVDQFTGRGAFRIHGDNRQLNRSASEGCIILPRAVREQMWTSGDHELIVVA